MRSFFAEAVFCFEVARGSPEGGPSMAAGQDRCISTGPRIFTIHAGTFAHNPLQKCSRSVLRTAKAFPKDRAAIFPFQRGPGVPEAAPEKSFGNQRGAPRWPQARFTAFLQGAVTPSMRANKFPKKVFKLDTFLKKAVSKIQVDRRLQSLHLKGVF